MNLKLAYADALTLLREARTQNEQAQAERDTACACLFAAEQTARMALERVHGIQSAVDRMEATMLRNTERRALWRANRVEDRREVHRQNKANRAAEKQTEAAG